VTKIRLPYIHEFEDRYGKIRRYVRRGGKRYGLPGAPGSEEFMAAYHAALQEHKPAPVGASRTRPGTTNAAVVSYISSSEFKALAHDTQRTRRNVLERYRRDFGDLPIVGLRPQDVAAMLAAKSGTPSAARNFLNTLRALVVHCMRPDIGILTEDPTRGVKRVKIKTDGYRTWSEDDIEKFREHHPIGTRARLAMELLLNTAQRRSDVVRLGRQHIRNGFIQIRQQKTGAELAIPVLPELDAVIRTGPADQLTFLTTAAGKPFTAAGFGNWFRDVCNEAGIPKGTSAHGLRKATCRRLAEAGVSANVIASISGHTSLREVQRYTKAAEQKRMAKAGMER
jgi:integrase